MSWPEVDIVQTEKRHEIILSGPTISEKIDRSGLDTNIFNIKSLNYLNIHETSLAEIPDAITKLVNLQTLVLHSNKLDKINVNISKLDKLKVLDLSRNQIKVLPQEFSNLAQLTTLNVSSNELETFPKFVANSKLQVLDIANNKLTEFPDICYTELVNLTDLKLNSNCIEILPSDVKNLKVLKNFDISTNKIKVVPGELIECTKLKELNLKENPITDRRFYKLIDQSRTTKQVLDYVKQNCPRSGGSGDTKGGKKGKKGQKEPETIEPVEDNTLKLKVLHYADDTVNVIVIEDVKKVRGHILACLLLDVKFTEDNFKKFIQMQTKLHDGVCKKRNAATIATHDAKKVGEGNITYTALPPKTLMIKPLNRKTTLSGEALFNTLQKEAENLRKEQKRNVYSGIHKYLYLLEGQKMYPCLLNSNQDVISFPPITNSEITKISLETTSILIEVTSPTSQTICKSVLDALLKETITLFNTDVVVQQIKNTDIDGNLKAVYPSKTDLIFEENVNFIVVRD